MTNYDPHQRVFAGTGDFDVILVRIKRRSSCEHTNCRAQFEAFVIHNLELERRIRTKLETDVSQVGPFGLTINDRIAVKRAA